MEVSEGSGDRTRTVRRRLQENRQAPSKMSYSVGAPSPTVGWALQGNVIQRSVRFHT